MNWRSFFSTKQRILSIALFIIVAIMTVIPSACQRNHITIQPISQLYVFGDSLSDVGNVYQATNKAYPPSPPYFQGRYSNGQVWAEQLASRLALQPQQVQNFAWGGATTGRSGISDVPGVLTQVEQFVSQNQSANSQALYVIWAGANDYLYSGATPERSIDNLSQAVRSLSKVGAKRFLVGNIPDLGGLPATRNNENSEALRQVAIAHNQTLETAINQLQQQLSIRIAELNSYAAYQDAVNNPQKYGFTNVTAAYLNAQTGRLAQNAPTQPPQASQFLFWDDIHPTTATHRILGDQAFSLVQAIVNQAN